jgi:hypothetical protein
MFQARILTLWTVMLAALVSNTALRSHAESDNHTAFMSFATNDKTATPPPLCTFEADIPSQCECVAALRLSDAVGSVGAGAVIGAVVFIARSGLNAFFCDEHVTFEDKDEDKETTEATVRLGRLSLCLECPPAPKCTPTPETCIDLADLAAEIRAEDDANARPAIDIGAFVVETPEPFNLRVAVKGAANNVVKAAASVAFVWAYTKIQRTRPYK